MRLIENDSDWFAAYLQDVEVANNELVEKNFRSDPNSVLCDIYALPSHNHQTFYGKLIAERGFFKIIYAKALQNSIWFSEPIYMYRFDEAKRFEEHPMRKGRIVCRAKLIEKSLVNRLMLTLEKLDDHQPSDTVTPVTDANFTAVRIYENGIASRKFLYTDAKKLLFRDRGEHSDEVEMLDNLYLSVEKIIGLGD